MAISNNLEELIVDFIDTDTVNAVKVFTNTAENNNSDVEKIAAMFGFAGSFTSSDENKIIESFNKNLKLLIEKTWVEKSDIALKEQILFQLSKLCEDHSDWAKVFKEFLGILNDAVYLMFGQQTKSEDFGEYSLRIDPGFGIFWWYIKSLPSTAEWPVEKCRNAILLGMYFLANY